MGGEIILKDDSQIAAIRESGKYLTELLHLLYHEVKPGKSLSDIEKKAKDFYQKNGVKAAFKGYQGFPGYLCLSVNDCIVHGIPDKYELKEGDLLKIDAGVIYKGGITDSAISIVLGGEDKNQKGGDLVKATKEGLDNSLGKIGPNEKMFDFSNSIYNFVTGRGFSIIKNLTGHGVGKYVHEKPHIYNWPSAKTKDISFQENMVLAIEPITAESSESVTERPGVSWNLFTQKGDLGAQREYTILINSSGYEIISGLM